MVEAIVAASTPLADDVPVPASDPIETPDLVVTSVAITSPTNGPAASGDTISVEWTVQNNGNGPTAIGGWTDLLVLSADSLLSVDDLSVAPPAEIAYGGGVLAAGESYTASGTIVLPDDLTGDFFAIVVADAIDDVEESFFEANNVAAQGTLTVVPPVVPLLPDLTVTGVTGPADASPGEQALVEWTTMNEGVRPAEGGWREAVYISDDDILDAGDTLVGEVIVGGPLEVGASEARAANVIIPPTGVSGDQRFLVVVDSLEGVDEVDEGNNTGASDAVEVPFVLSFSGVPESVTEEQGSFTILLSRSGDLSTPLEAFISTDPSELEVSVGSVEFAVGQQSASIVVTPVDDGVVDGDQAVQLTGVSFSPFPFAIATATVTVVDTDLASVGLSLSNDEVTEGSGATLTVERSGPLTDPVTVSLATSVNGQIDLPNEVTVPAGAPSVEVPFTAIDDDFIENAGAVLIQASAAGFEESGAGVTVEVLDNDAPTLALTTSQDTINEGDGGFAATGTVTIDEAQPFDVIVLLDSSDDDEVFVPPAVLISQGETTASFGIGAVEDGLNVDPGQVQITASLAETFDTTQPVVGSEVSQTLTVTDNDGDTFSIAIDRSVVAEGVADAATVTVTRNSSPGTPQVVDITISDPSEIDANITGMQVTIPANESAVAFTINSLDDAVADGIQSVAITASAAGFVSDSATIDVSDIQFPDLVIQSLAVVDPPIANEGTFEFSFELSNIGSATAVGPVKHRFYLSTNTAINAGDLEVAEFETSADLAPGEASLFTVTGTIPEDNPLVPGDFYLLAVTDVDNSVVENDSASLITFGEGNNLSASSPFSVAPLVTATVELDDADGVFTPAAGEAASIRLFGTATETLTGAPAADARLSVHIRTGNSTRRLEATANGDGEYEVIFTPAAGETGDYTFGVGHIAEPSSQIDFAGAFSILGMSFADSFFDASVTVGESGSATVLLGNESGVGLTDLTVTVATPDGLPSDDFSVEASLPASEDDLAGDGTLAIQIDYESIGPTATDLFPSEPNFLIQVESAEGVAATLPVYLQATEPLSRLVTSAGISQNIVSNSAGREFEALFSLTIENVGAIGTGAIEVAVSGMNIVDAVRLVSGSTLDSLAPQQEQIIELAVAANAQADAGNMLGGTIVITTSHEVINIPLEFTLISKETGDVRFTVTDEFTEDTGDPPEVDLATAVVGATVTLRDIDTNEIVFSGTTGMGGDPQGVVTATGIRSGYYQLVVDSPLHSPVSRVYFVQPTEDGDAIAQEVFISRETVEYSFRVTEQVGDEDIQIEVETEFAEDIPVAAVAVANAVIDLSGVEVGESQQFNVVIENRGGQASTNLEVVFEEHPFYDITPLVNFVTVLPGGSSFTLPIEVAKTADPQPGDDSPRTIDGGVYWSYTSRGQLVTKLAPIVAINADQPDVETQPAQGFTAPPGPTEFVFDPGFGPPSTPTDQFPGFNEFTRSVIGDTGVNFPSITIGTLPERGEAVLDIGIDQAAVTTRDFFVLTLAIENPSAADLTSFLAELRIFDEQDADVTHLFTINPVDIAGQPAADGNGTIGTGTTAVFQWSLNATAEATESGATAYYVGGDIEYFDNNAVEGGSIGLVEVGINPAPIIVEPLAELSIDYFLEPGVIGDNPLTFMTIEPSVPFTLAALVENQGAGVADDLSVVGALPTILDLTTGAPLEFEVVGARVFLDADEDGELEERVLPPSLSVELGDLAPGEIATIEWLLVSNQLGRLESIDVTLSYTDGLGGPQLSSFNETVNIESLVRVVQAERAADDNVPDFVVEDDLGLPSTLFLSDGATESVSFVDSATVAPGETGGFSYAIEAETVSGFNLIRIEDPSGGSGADRRLVSVQRSDGSELLDANFYQTDFTFVEAAFPVEEFLVNIFDHDPLGDGAYTLSYVEVDSTGPGIVAVVPGSDPATDFLDTVLVTFTEPIDEVTLDARDIAIVSVTDPMLEIETPAGIVVSLVPGTDSVYEISGLGPATAFGGVYRIDIDASGVLDDSGNPGVGAGMATFNVTAVPPLITGGTVQQGLAQRSYVNTFSIDFDAEMNLEDAIESGDITSAITLTIQGAGVALTPSDFTYVYNPTTGVSRLTWAQADSLGDGSYTLVVDGSGLYDASGVALDADGDGMAEGKFILEFYRLQGDTNSDRVVDASDSTVVDEALGATPGTADWNPNADLDQDGVVTVRDRILVATNLGNVVAEDAPAAVTLAIPGDFNGDEVVDAADYAVWRNNLGRTDATSASGDADGDGVVSSSDYDIWRQNFGTTLEAYAAEIGLSASAEPIGDDESDVVEAAAAVIASEGSDVAAEEATMDGAGGAGPGSVQAARAVAAPATREAAFERFTPVDSLPWAATRPTSRGVRALAARGGSAGRDADEQLRLAAVASQQRMMKHTYAGSESEPERRDRDTDQPRDEVFERIGLPRLDPFGPQE